MSAPAWDPDQYERFRQERERPFDDLVARLPARAYVHVVDLGCGTGRLTQRLAASMPDARVVGLDRSREMIGRARTLAGRAGFVRADITRWWPRCPLSLVFSHAALQWAPDHARLLGRFVDWLEPGGVLAVQVPANHDAPAHRALQSVVSSPRWRRRLEAVGLGTSVRSLADYERQLLGLGCRVEAWDTTYDHVVDGRRGVLAWLAGTALRPHLARLSPMESPRFLADLEDALAPHFPEHAPTRYPFRRRFFVAQRPPPP